MERVVLIHPKTGMDIKGISINLPLALLFISSNLVKAGYRVGIIDQRLEADWEARLVEALLEKPVCLGITAITGGQIEWGLRASRVAKETAPSVPVVWGGIHPSLLPEQTVRHPLVDVAVSGCAEETFLELVQALARNRAPRGIPGVFFKEGAEIVQTPRGYDIPQKTHDLPFHLIDVRSYLCNLYKSRNSLDVLASRGCPHRCCFCYNLNYNAGRYRFFDPEWIVSNIDYVQRQGAGTISLISDNFFSDKSRVAAFCELMRKRGAAIDLSANCRADYLVRFGRDFLRYLRETGFTELFVGVESGSDRVLELIKKDTTVGQVRAANGLLREAGIAPIYSFMAGFPGETFEDVKKTLGLMEQLKRDNPGAFLTSIKIATPFPGTELYDRCLMDGFVPPDTLEGWSDFFYNKSNFRWGTEREMRTLEKISYATYFFDQESMSRHFGKNRVLKLLIKIYSKTVEWRIKLNILSFIPEYTALRKLYSFISRSKTANYFRKPAGPNGAGKE